MMKEQRDCVLRVCAIISTNTEIIALLSLLFKEIMHR